MHSANDGGGVLCMINKELMLVINIHGEGFSLIDVLKHEVIKKFEKKERIYL